MKIIESNKLPTVYKWVAITWFGLAAMHGAHAIAAHTDAAQADAAAEALRHADLSEEAEAYVAVAAEETSERNEALVLGAVSAVTAASWAGAAFIIRRTNDLKHNEPQLFNSEQ